MKHKLDLAAPVTRGDGISQTKVEPDYIYIKDDHTVCYTKQGNAVRIEDDEDTDKFLIAYMKKVKNKLENP